MPDRNDQANRHGGGFGGQFSSPTHTCDLWQRYWLGRPLPAAATAFLLQAQAARQR
ncbi:MAG: hypothetical protein KJ787_13230 [Gammaproteobacteria bacterium]|nr:hypothetical protein [Gammaproteobacteria bacterium]MBU1647287.1 hypothetical protein [Gammaproteobacteria bacterium]MBU1972799.1 hypothetical protein [Gammaproteobacteria bacterium]